MKAMIGCIDREFGRATRFHEFSNPGNLTTNSSRVVTIERLNFRRSFYSLRMQVYFTILSLQFIDVIIFVSESLK